MKRDAFAKKFAAWVTFFGCLFITAYVFIPAYFKIALGDDSKTVLGFVMGTMVTTAINWAIGTSKSSEDKTHLMRGGTEDATGKE